MLYSVYIYSVRCLKLSPSSISFLLHEYANTAWLVESILPEFWDSTKRIIQLLSVPKWMHFLWTDWKIHGLTLTTLRHLTTSSRVLVFPMYFRFFLSMCFPLFCFVFCFLFFFSIPVHFGRAVRGRSSPVISCSAGGHPVGAKWPGPVNGDETRYLHNLRPVFFFFFFF